MTERAGHPTGSLTGVMSGCDVPATLKSGLFAANTAIAAGFLLPSSR